MTVCEISRAFACILLQLGMLVRGGISRGGLVHSRRVLFGPGLISAYDLETTEAKSPRIILSHECADMAETTSKSAEPISEYFERTIRIDSDGLSYVHVLRELEEMQLKDAPSRYETEWWETVRTHLDRMIELARDQPYEEKLRWFEAYHSRSSAG